MARNYAALPYEYKREMRALSDAEFGRLCRALIDYSESGTPIALCGNERFYAERIMMQEDRYKENYNKIAKRNLENGANGGRPKTHVNPDEPKRTQKTHTETETETETNNSPPNGGRVNTPLPPKGFDAFWLAYPKKVGKQAALKAWSKLKPDAELTQTILQAVEYQRKSAQWKRDGGQYIPNPATWLNQGRWEDELPNSKGGTDFLLRSIMEDLTNDGNRGQRLPVPDEAAVAELPGPTGRGEHVGCDPYVDAVFWDSAGTGSHKDDPGDIC